MRYKKEEESALSKIYRATSELITSKDYNKVNCSEIIAKANISRSTFYMYFKNKEQILIHMCDDIFNHIFMDKISKESHHDFSKHHTIEDIFVHSFCHFNEDKILILSILNSGASNIFLKQLRKRIKPFIIKAVEEGILTKKDVPMDLLIHQYINSYVALLQYYLRHGENMTPHEVAKYYILLNH